MSQTPDSASTSALPDVSQHLAEELRRQRKARGWSLDQAAQASGVSKAMLGQIERGESSPTVATLWKIASGFGCSLSRFIAAPVPVAQMPVFRDAGSVRSKPASDRMLVAPLFPFDAHLGFELLELTLLPGYVRQSEAHANGVIEHVTVLRGEMEVFIEDQWHPLAEGQAVRFAADRPHGYRNLTVVPAVCHNLIHYPAVP